MKNILKYKKTLCLMGLFILSVVIIKITGCSSGAKIMDVSDRFDTDPYLKKSYTIGATYKTITDLDGLYTFQTDRCRIDHRHNRLPLPVGTKADKFVFKAGTRFKILRLEHRDWGGGARYVTPFTVLESGKYKGKEIYVGAISKTNYRTPVQLHMPDSKYVEKVR